MMVQVQSCIVGPAQKPRLACYSSVDNLRRQARRTGASGIKAPRHQCHRCLRLYVCPLIGLSALEDLLRHSDFGLHDPHHPPLHSLDLLSISRGVVLPSCSITSSCPSAIFPSPPLALPRLRFEIQRVALRSVNSVTLPIRPTPFVVHPLVNLASLSLVGRRKEASRGGIGSQFLWSNPQGSCDRPKY